MTALEALWQQPVMRVVGAALAGFLWQGSAVALVVGALLAALKRRPARERYAVACLGLLTMAVLPVASCWAALAGAPSTPTAGMMTVAGGVEELILVQGGAAPARWLERLQPWLMSAWLAGVLLLSLRTVLGWRRAQGLAHRGTCEPEPSLTHALARVMERMRMSQPVRLLTSVAIEVPVVVGLWRPLILVPASSLAGLTPSQLEAILAHELAHIRRHDYLVNLLQTLVETVLFYHPAVWWLSARIREEREHCADDLAVESCGDALLYARALAQLEQLRTAFPAPVLAASGGSLLTRIRRLLAVPEGGAPRRPWRLAGGLVAATMVVVLGASRQAQATVENEAPPMPTLPHPMPMLAGAPSGLEPAPLTPARVTSSVAREAVVRTRRQPRVAEDSSPGLPGASMAVAPSGVVAPVMAEVVAAVTAMAGSDVSRASTAPEPLPRSDDMTPPRFLSGEPLKLPRSFFERNATARHVGYEAEVHTRCTITEGGSVQDCEVLQAPAGLHDAVLRALTSRRYAPARHHGQPVSVGQTFVFKLRGLAVTEQAPTDAAMPAAPAPAGPGPSIGQAPPESQEPGAQEEVLDFGEGMTPPRKLSGEPLRFPASAWNDPDAWNSDFKGTVVARCTLTTEGTLTDCELAERVPFLDAEVLRTLATWRFTPVRFQGQPVAVRQTFNLRFNACVPERTQKWHRNFDVCSAGSTGG